MAIVQCSPALAADTIENTPYGRACFRLEARQLPKDKPAAIDQLEPALAHAGVDGRWIQVVDDGGDPLVENPCLPCPYGADIARANEKLLTHWVDRIHRSGMSALSWFSLTYCPRGNALHPDWRQVSILPWPHAGSQNGPCCVNSPYGDALIAYCNWADRTIQTGRGLVDGSFFTPVWERPLPLRLVPEEVQGGHRPGNPGKIRLGQSDIPPVAGLALRDVRAPTSAGCPKPYARSIRTQSLPSTTTIAAMSRGTAGSQWTSSRPTSSPVPRAYTAESVDQTMRLCRAYGSPAVRSVAAIRCRPNPRTGVEHLLEHALACYVAGGHPSFGYDSFAGQDENAVAAAALMTPIMRTIHPCVRGNSLSYCAMHVSQQTETFCFGPGQGRTWDKSPYFEPSRTGRKVSAWPTSRPTMSRCRLCARLVGSLQTVANAPLDGAERRSNRNRDGVRPLRRYALVGPRRWPMRCPRPAPLRKHACCRVRVRLPRKYSASDRETWCHSMVEAGGRQTTVPAVRHAPLPPDRNRMAGARSRRPRRPGPAGRCSAPIRPRSRGRHVARRHRPAG